LQQEIAALPGVVRVALEDCPPLNNGCNGTIMTFADRPRSATGNAMVGVHWVSPDWFATMRVPIVRGRGFTPADRLGAPKVVLINQAAARKYFPGEDPIGRQVGVWQGGFDTGAEIIGIVGDVKYGTIDSTAKPDAYISYGQARIPRMMLFVRTAGDPSSMAAGVRAAVRRVAPMAPVYDMQPMTSRVAVASSQARFSAILLALFAAVALSLAAIGIYGVMSFAVAQRNREIGLRMALGASGASVLTLVMREAAIMAIAGLALGLLGALSFTRLLQGLLFDTSTTDLATYVLMVVVLGGTALAASWIPARRAARVDPMIALRQG
jgi:putative ABC transport system permease protein